MKTENECVGCFCRGAFNFADKIGIPPESKVRALKDVLRMIADSDFSQPPPLIAERIYSILSASGKKTDAFRGEKDRSTECAKALLAGLAPRIECFSDRFEAYLRLAIAGNIIDFGVDCHFDLDTARKLITDSFETPLDPDAVALLKEKLEQARNVLYIADNCGEALFDSRLIGMYHDKMTAAVRGKPILNDVTRREAAASGLSEAAARVIDTGDSVPGVCLERSSPEFVNAFRSADLIIAKGQGNFETLGGCGRPVFFLFRAKCPVVVRNLGNVEFGSCQIRHENIS